MDMTLKTDFMERWAKYFPNTELPLTFFYTADPSIGETVDPPSEGRRCAVALLTMARKGRVLCLDAPAVSCPGGKRYFGFTNEIRPEFPYFLSCGIPGKLEGERYKQSPEIVIETMKQIPTFTAPAPYIVFKRWDLLEAQDDPIGVIFFAKPDVLSGLYTLAGFDETCLNSVEAPFGAGCATIVQYPYLQQTAERPKAFLGMFDVSSRPRVAENLLTFAAPMNKFTRMIHNMDQSFLITHSWEMVQKRL